MSILFELVIFNASISDYVNPLLNKLEPNRRISYRLIQRTLYFFWEFIYERFKDCGRNYKLIIL